jgi:hypothetical protein
MQALQKSIALFAQQFVISVLKIVQCLRMIIAKNVQTNVKRAQKIVEV